MHDIRIMTGKQIIPEFDTVAALLQVQKDDCQYDTLLRQYESVLPNLRMYMQPKAAVGMFLDAKEGRFYGKRMLAVIFTIGKGVDKLCQSCFAHHDGEKALLVNAMADVSLFAFEEQVLGVVRRMGEEEGFGVCRRWDAPMDMPMEYQKAAFDSLDAAKRLNMEITSAYMLSPLKSMCFFLELSEQRGQFTAEHDCAKCDNLACTLRKISKVEITVSDCGKEDIFCCEAGIILSDLLKDKHFLQEMPCDGKGTCGKCKIKLLKGDLPVAKAEKALLTKEELASGIRLSCQTVITESVHIAMETGQRKMQIVSDVKWKDREDSGTKQTVQMTGKADETYSIAIDIGSTTLVFALVSHTTKQVVSYYSSMNSQRCMGADVLSRIQSSLKPENRQKLKETIINDLNKGIQNLLDENYLSMKQIAHIVMAGNTTMFHLLRGYSCEGLAKAPFVPVSTEIEVLAYEELFGRTEAIKLPEITLLAGASAFIGADILSGFYASWNELENTLFIDLGTNGEMAFVQKDKILASSTAAGPAFECANITCGVGSVEGAVCGSEWNRKKAKLHLRTIEDKLPIGICGTGLIEIIAELLKQNIILNDGYMPSFAEEGYPLTEDGKIRLYQKDIRELQLAKSAIRTGIELLLKHQKATYDDVTNVILAGGFGYYLNVEKAAFLGLLPEELVSKTTAAGNASLAGAIRFLLNEDGKEKIQKLRNKIEILPLAGQREFEELYLQYINFNTNRRTSERKST